MKVVPQGLDTTKTSHKEATDISNGGTTTYNDNIHHNIFRSYKYINKGFNKVRAWTVVGISPCYRGRNGSLMSIGQKGRFLHVENIERKQNGQKAKNKKEYGREPLRKHG